MKKTKIKAKLAKTKKKLVKTSAKLTKVMSELNTEKNQGKSPEKPIKKNKPAVRSNSSGSSDLLGSKKSNAATLGSASRTTTRKATGTKVSARKPKI